MHTTDPTLLARLARAFGQPAVLHWRLPILAWEARMVRKSSKGWRWHDITLVIHDAAGRLVIITKPMFPNGVWRWPSGGVDRDEPFVAGAEREGREETGLALNLERYLLRIHATFTHPVEGEVPWVSHIFSATAAATELVPEDTHEISGARWVTPAELRGWVHENLWATERPLLRYRVLLQEAALRLLLGQEVGADLQAPTIPLSDENNSVARPPGV